MWRKHNAAIKQGQLPRIDPIYCEENDV